MKAKHHSILLFTFLTYFFSVAFLASLWQNVLLNDVPTNKISEKVEKYCKTQSVYQRLLITIFRCSIEILGNYILFPFYSHWNWYRWNFSNSMHFVFSRLSILETGWKKLWKGIAHRCIAYTIRCFLTFYHHWDKQNRKGNFYILFSKHTHMHQLQSLNKCRKY